MFKMVTSYVFRNEEEVALQFALMDYENSTIRMEDVQTFETSLKELMKKVNLNPIKFYKQVQLQ